MLTLRPSPLYTCPLLNTTNLRGRSQRRSFGAGGTDQLPGLPDQRSDDRSGPRPVGASSSRFNNLSVEWRPKKVIRFGPESVIDRRRSGDRMSPEYATGRNF